jgi:hypothetical protein
MRLQVPRRTLLVYSVVTPLLLTSLVTGFAKGSYASGASTHSVRATSGGLVQPTRTFASRPMDWPKLRFEARVIHLRHGGTGSGATQVSLCYPSGCVADLTTQLTENTCGSGKKAIVTIDTRFKSYGIYNVYSGGRNGTCEFTVQDSTNGLSATERVVNRTN